LKRTSFRGITVRKKREKGWGAALAAELENDLHGHADGKQELRVWLRLLSATKLISQEIRRRLRTEFGATLPQFDLLAQLDREPDGLRLGEISKRTMVTNGNITGLVERLEADGLVARETPGDDRRVTVARLTETGRRAFAEMAAAHEGWVRDLMADVDKGTLSGLARNIDQIQLSVRNHLSENDSGSD
jgi:DNA-binding MarR family transcriptional regulator